jgi:hypothetical protein
MTPRPTIVRQVISLAKLPSARRRREVERELREHLEDLAEEARSHGYDEALIERMASTRFGDPQQVAAAFVSVYAFERWAHRALSAGILLLASVAAVTLAVGSVQSSAALFTGTPFADSFKGIPWELLGLGAIALGYCGAYLAERVCLASPAKATALSIVLALWAAMGLFSVVPDHAVLPAVAFASAVLARLLQRVPVPLLWFAGTAAPLTITALAFHLWLPGQGPPLWLLWVGLTVSCTVLRRIVCLFEKSNYGGIFT